MGSGPIIQSDVVNGGFRVGQMDSCLIVVGGRFESFLYCWLDQAVSYAFAKVDRHTHACTHALPVQGKGSLWSLWKHY